MNQPNNPSVHLELSALDRNILIAFIDAGMKAEVSRVGINGDVEAITRNAVRLAKQLSEATPEIFVPADITDPPAANP